MSYTGRGELTFWSIPSSDQEPLSDHVYVMLKGWLTANVHGEGPWGQQVSEGRLASSRPVPFHGESTKDSGWGFSPKRNAPLVSVGGRLEDNKQTTLFSLKGKVSFLRH